MVVLISSGLKLLLLLLLLLLLFLLFLLLLLLQLFTASASVAAVPAFVTITASVAAVVVPLLKACVEALLLAAFRCYSGTVGKGVPQRFEKCSLS